MNFAFSGGLVPGMELMNKKEDSSWDGGDPGLNYRFLSVPEDNENNYTSKQLEENGFLGGLFPCRRACKEKLGGKGFGFRDCLRECRGKGLRKSQLKTKDLEIQQQLIQSLSQNSDSGARTGEEEGGEGNSKMFILIIVAAILVIGICLAIYFLTRKKEGE
jgi:hypothetical protein